jgi:large subunit ribosomal protein L4e
VGANVDVEKAKSSRAVRAGKGKMRNRRYVARKGPLVVYSNDEGISRSFRNIPGVEVACVERLNLLQLAPGGHAGRFIVWTKGAVEKLNGLYGTATAKSTSKKGYTPMRPLMANSDLNRIINSDEIQSIVNAPKTSCARAPLKKNPLKNLGAMLKLNPYAQTATRMQLLAEANRKAGKTKKVASARSKTTKAVGAKFYKQMIVDSDYVGDRYNNFSSWLTQGQGEAAADE